jgi:hypothetical protein
MCSYCGSPLLADRKPGFNEVCELCGKDLHVCLNCRFFSKEARWECSETVDEHVLDKGHRNHCDWYENSPTLLRPGAGRAGERKSADQARRDLDRLFGG